MLAGSNYLRGLARLGLRPEDIDTVICTHLHGDHVGWNTHLVDGRWVPTFPHARYVMARQDYDHFSSLAICPSLTDSVLPVVEAGQAEFVDISAGDRYHLDDDVWLEAAPGHTPGHVVIHVDAPDANAMLSGDVIHHPVQFIEPALSNLGDVDPAMARHTRQRLLAAACADRSLLLTGHFPSPTAGYVVAAGDGLRFVFTDA
jgi:glyoxylase-like metal-dependent hydrolase (beta-lactamase superfamily II)